MQDLLNRSEAPLTEDEWARVDEAVVSVARRVLVGRRVLDVFGPLGSGMQDTDYNVYGPMGEATISLLGEEDESPIRPAMRVHQQIPLLYKDFTIFWRDLDTSRRMGTPIDTGAAAAASVFVAQKEDDLIFNGNESYGFPGLLNAKGALSAEVGDWTEAGSAFESIAAAVQLLIGQGFYPPYAVVVNPVAFAQMQRIYANSGVLEIEHISQLVQGGVYQTQTITNRPGVILTLGQQNFDVAVAQDLITAYLDSEGLNHNFRVMETLALRIKRPQAICVLDGPAPDVKKVGK